jgi:hypothetical protein
MLIFDVIGRPPLICVKMLYFFAMLPAFQKVVTLMLTWLVTGVSEPDVVADQVDCGGTAVPELLTNCTVTYCL